MKKLKINKDVEKIENLVETAKPNQKEKDDEEN